MGDLSQLVETIEKDREFVKRKFKIKSSSTQSTIEIDKCTLEKWCIKMRQFIFERYADFELSTLRVLVIGSKRNLNSILTESETQLYAQQGVLFVEICMSNFEDDWINAVCSIRFVNSVLESVTKSDQKVAILDVRENEHVHVEDFGTKTHQNQEAQEDFLFKIHDRLSRAHHFIAKYITQDMKRFQAALDKLQATGFDIRGLTVPDRSDIEYDKNVEEKKAHKEKEKSNKEANMKKVEKSKDHFLAQRLEKVNQECRAYSRLRLYLTLASQPKWIVRQVTFEDVDDFISDLKNDNEDMFTRSTYDPNLYYQRSGQDFLYVLMSSQRSENEVLMFSNCTGKIKNLCAKYYQKHMIAFIRMPHRFLGINIEYCPVPKCYQIHLKHRIEHLKRKYNIVTVDENNQPIMQLNPIVYNKKFHEGLEYDTSVTDHPVCELLTDLEAVQAQGRPDACLSVRILRNYLHKPSDSLWKYACGILLYLYQTRWTTLRLQPTGKHDGYTDASSKPKKNNNQRNDKPKPKPTNCQSKQAHIPPNVEKTVKLSQIANIYRYSDSLISWSSELLDIDGVDDSKTEVIELAGAACLAAEICIHRKLLTELGLCMDEGQVKLFVDSRNAITEVQSRLDQFDKTDSIAHLTAKDESGAKTELPQCDPYLHTLLYFCLEENYALVDTRSGNNMADCFTKVNVKKSSSEIRNMLGMVDNAIAN